MANLWEEKSVYEFIKAKFINEEIEHVKQKQGHWESKTFTCMRDDKGVIIDANHPDVVSGAKSRFIEECAKMDVIQHLKPADASPIPDPVDPSTMPTACYICKKDYTQSAMMVDHFEDVGTQFVCVGCFCFCS